MKLTYKQCNEIKRQVRRYVQRPFIEVGERVDLDNGYCAYNTLLFDMNNTDLYDLVGLDELRRRKLEIPSASCGEVLLDLYIHDNRAEEFYGNLDCHIKADGTIRVYDPFAKGERNYQGYVI